MKASPFKVAYLLVFACAIYTMWSEAVKTFKTTAKAAIQTTTNTNAPAVTPKDKGTNDNSDLPPNAPADASATNSPSRNAESSTNGLLRTNLTRTPDASAPAPSEALAVGLDPPSRAHGHTNSTTLLSSIQKLFQKYDFNMAGYYLLLLVAGLVFSAHMIRVYLSLGMLEHDEQMYNKLIAGLTPGQKRAEFAVRNVLIIIVSLKFTPWGNVSNCQKLGVLLMVVYGVMLAWDLLMMRFTKSKSVGSFVKTSVTGFGQGVILVVCSAVFATEEKFLVWEAASLALCAIIIGKALLLDCQLNGKSYWDYLRGLFSVNTVPPPPAQHGQETPEPAVASK
jgi:hypothetical protein